MTEQSLYLNPLSGEPTIRKFCVFDIESKNGDTQKAGFTRPFAVGFYDGETYKCFRNDPEVASLPWDERATARGGCLDKFMRYFLGECAPGQKPETSYRDYDIYAHNMGAFDGLFLPSWIQKNHRKYSYKVMPMQSRIQAIEIWKFTPNRKRQTLSDIKKADGKDRKASGVFRFLDSIRVMPISLDAMAKTFGLEGKLSHDLNMPEDDPHWDKYLYQDCEQLYLSMIKFHGIVRDMGGEVGITAPATAMKILRKKYIKEDLKIHRNVHFPNCKIKRADGTTCTGCAHEFFRSAYFGGRTELFQKEGTGKYWDVNSSYPFSMKKAQPVGPMTVLSENEDFSHLVDTHVGFVRCTVNIPESTYLPPLPVPLDGKLKFPTGTFSGTWDWVELAALGRVGGKILHVEKSIWVKGEKFLTQYVDDLYAYRDKKNPKYNEGMAAIAKIMLNSTFGKFGMEQDRVEIVILKPGEPEPSARKPGESKKHWLDRKQNERWKLPEIDTPPGLPPVPMQLQAESPIRIREVRIDACYIIPQIAAHITALSRILLWSLAMDMLDQGYQVYYSDTDSLITNCDSLKDSSDLGGVKKEYNGETVSVIAFAPKMYMFSKETPFANDHEKEKGKKLCLDHCPGCTKDDKGKPIKGDHEVDESGNRLCLKKCPGCAKWKIMMKGIPRDFRTPEVVNKLMAGEEIEYDMLEKLGALMRGGFTAGPHMKKVKKSIRSKYDKRIFLPNGDTKPICLTEADEHISKLYLDWRTSHWNSSNPNWLTTVTKGHEHG